MSKDIDSLKESREKRRAVIEKYGDVPLSVWTPNIMARDVIKYKERNVTKITEKHHKASKADYDKRLYKEFSTSGRNVRGKTKGVSTFPPDLSRRILNFYSEENEIVVDPFAGHNSRMQTTYEMNRHYIGYDVSVDFMKFNREVREHLLKTNRLFSKRTTIHLHEKSSEEMTEKDEYADLIFTSPPYYNIEWYGDEKEQLGKSKTYEEFLERMLTIVKECYRVLKTDKFCVFNINDFRTKNKFFTYHCDIVDLFRKAGFVIWDIVIVWWGTSIAACFASQVEERKVTAKSHEYLVVGRKM